MARRKGTSTEIKYCAEVAKLVDALASGVSDRKIVGVRLSLSAQKL